MSGYSDQDLEKFAKVKSADLCHLLTLVSVASIRNRAVIAARYAQSASEFTATLQVAANLGWLAEDGEMIEPAHSIVGRIAVLPERFRAEALAEALCDGVGQYQRSLARYLLKFDWHDGAFRYFPRAGDRLLHSPERDFLMGLGAVTHDLETGEYELSSQFRFMGVWARNLLGRGSSSDESRRRLGLGAELEVLSWEQHRLGEQWADRVIHVSVSRPFASYDIESLTLGAGQPIKRYVEVKAVPAATFRFHWSAQEVETSEILGDSYFLYLLPVLESGGFDVERLMVIQNPFLSVFNAPEVWLKTPMEFLCEQRSTST